MKIAYVMPHSYEEIYPKQMNEYDSPEGIDYKILCKSDDSEHRFCRATQLVGIEPIFYYFSGCAKNTMEFIHKYGYLMKKIPVIPVTNIGARAGAILLRSYQKYGWEFSYTLLKQLSNDATDLIFVFTYALNNLLPLDMYDILALYCKKNKYPLIARHGGGSAHILILNGRCTFYGRQQIKKSTLNMADKIIVASRREFFILRDYLKIEPRKLVFLKDPVDSNNFYEISKEIAAKKLDKDPTKKYVLYVGRVHIEKGIQHIINVLPQLIKIYPKIVFLIVGTGPFENEIRRLVREKKLQDHVCIEGLVFHDSLKFYYNIADALVLTSGSEGSPNVVQEALACNTPIIGTSVGSIPEILSDHVGMMIPPDRSLDIRLFESMKKILDGNFEINQEKRKKLLNEWSMGNVGQTLKAIYEEVLGKY